MSAHKDVIERYLEGFRRGDHAQILSCLTQDIVWELHGQKTVRGKDAFNAAIDTDFFEGEPALGIYRMIEEGDAVAVTGGGRVSKKGGEQAWFVFSEVFQFSGQLISRLETYHIWVPWHAL
jgi:ketosteroid isomerase-like protein